MSGRELFLKYYRRAEEEGRSFLFENEAAEICQEYSLPLPEGGFAQDAEAAVALARRIGYPVVVKVVSPQVLHKSDVEGVRVGISGDDDLREACTSISETVRGHLPEARIRGYFLARMAGKGVETIVGLQRDDFFGPVVMFGIGGVLVELYKDVTFRLCPLAEETVDDMLSELKGKKLLEGFRGIPKADVGSLKQVVLALSTLGIENPEIGSVDLNPVMVNDKGALALDARILLK